MRAKLLLLAVVAMTLLTLSAHRPALAEKDKDKEEAMLVHHVYFTLNKRTAEEKKKLVEACKKHLTKHEGEVFFSAGTLAEDLKRELNDLDFDVCLTIVFKNKAAHDTYQDHKRHKQFIDENKAAWKKVRVFDSYATK